MRGKTRRLGKWATLALTIVMVFAWVVPAQALDPIIIFPPIIFFPLTGIDGTVTDSGTSAPIQGIIVSAYKDSDGSYAWSTVTNATGQYSLWLDNADDYKLQFRDPSNKYGEQWANNQANFDDGSDFTPALPYHTVNVQMHTATTLKNVVRRIGHPYTRIKGSYVIVQQKSAVNTVQTFSKTVDKYAAATFKGLRGTNVTYKESAIDPSGMFYSGDATSTWLPYYGGTTNTIYIDLYVAGESKNVTITVPSSKSTVNAGSTFAVAVTASRNITTSQKMMILAKKGSTTKRFYLPKVSHPTGGSTKYLKGIKLSKGTWTLYAVWPGSSKYSTTDSVTGKTVKAK